MGEWVLILWLSIGHVGGAKEIDFADKAACDAALAEAKETFRGTGWTVRGYCVPRSSTVRSR
jgi:hypothetical protein